MWTEVAEAEAIEAINKGDYVLVLLENDLPDIAAVQCIMQAPENLRGHVKSIAVSDNRPIKQYFVWEDK